MNRTHARRRRPAGHTLVELVLSMTLLAIVMASAGSAMLFAAKASPRADGPTATLIRDGGAMNRLAEDLAQAKYVLAYSSNSVKILVDDRTGDGAPDHLSYAWSGTPGDPLTYTLNDGTPVNLVDAVQTFELDIELTPVVTTIPPAIYYGPEKLISAFEGVWGAQMVVSPTNSYGQQITPTLSAGAIGFLPTQAQLYAQKANNDDGVMGVALRGAAGTTPNNTVYGQAEVIESLLANDDWYAIDLIQTVLVPDGQGLALVSSYVSGSTNVAQVRTSGSLLGGMIQSNNGGGSWSAVLFTELTHRLYGREVFTANEGFDIKRNHATAVTVSLQSVADDRSPIQRRVRLLRGPELLDTFWDTRFDASPVSQDLNDDKAADWVYAGGGELPDADLSGGAWDAKNALAPNPSASIDGVVRIDARLRAAVGQDASIQGPYVLDGDDDNLPIICTLRRSAGEAQELVVYNDAAQTTPLFTVTGLGEDWVDVHLTVLPSENTMYLKINGESYGSFYLAREEDIGLRGVYFTGAGAGSMFTDARVSVGGSYTELADGSGLLGGVLDALGGLLN
jgi:hypothetical protein